MSSRALSLGVPSVGVGTPYHNILELVHDRQRIKLLAEAMEISLRHVRKDTCDQWGIVGRTGAHLQTYDDQSYLLYVVTYSTRKWGAIKRKAKALGCEVTQDGDDEGCICLGLPNKELAKFLRSLLGLRRRQARSDGAPINEGGSLA